MDRFNGIAATAAAMVGVLLSFAAAAGPTSGNTVADEQLRILRSELDREETALAEAVKRRAERLAAADAAGTRDAELAQTRAADNVAALKREIEAVQRSPAARSRAEPQATSQAIATPRVNAAPTRWWDVYAHPPARTALPAAVEPNANP